MTTKQLNRGLKVKIAKTGRTGDVMGWFQTEVLDTRTGREWKVWHVWVQLDGAKPYRVDGKVMRDNVDCPQISELRLAR